MAKNSNRLFMHPTQSTTPMPLVHSYTIVARDDDEDSVDICVSCIGECTCTKPQPTQAHDVIKEKQGPLSMKELELMYAAGTPGPTPKPSKREKDKMPMKASPSLKIKLNLGGQNRSASTSSSSRNVGTISDFVHDGYQSYSEDRDPSPSSPVASTSTSAHTQAPPKKRGRPSKASIAARNGVASTSSSFASSSTLPPASHHPSLVSQLHSRPSHTSASIHSVPVPALLKRKPLTPKSAAPGKPRLTKPGVGAGQGHQRKRSSSVSNAVKVKAKANLKSGLGVAGRSAVVRGRGAAVPRGRGAFIKKAPLRRKKNFNDDEESDSSLTSLSDVDMDASRSLFPTFVEASSIPSLVLTSSHSSSSSSSSSGSSSGSSSSESDDDDALDLGDDANLLAEEESFILADMDNDHDLHQGHDQDHHLHKLKKKEKARMRRALLGDESPFNANLNRYSKREKGDKGDKKKKVNEEWVIKPRKRSVGVSGDEMDDEEEDEMDEDLDEEDGVEEVGGREEDGEADVETEVVSASASGTIAETTVGAPALMDEDPESDEEAARRRRYVGLATGWSDGEDDEEDSFDADLFFSNLYGSSSSSSEDEGEDTTSKLGAPFSFAGDAGEEDGDGDESSDDFDIMSEDAETETESHPLHPPFLPPPPPNALSIPTPAFELTESWDGQVVFTNGIGFEYDDLGSMTSATSATDSPYTSRSSSVNGFGGRRKVRKGLGKRGRRRRKALARVGLMRGSEREDEGDVESSEGEGDDLTGSLTLDAKVKVEDGADGVGLDDADEEQEEGDGGDTTDEDLIGADSLPNERAMRIFKFPESIVSSLASSLSADVLDTSLNPFRVGEVDAIDPMSIVSSPVVPAALPSVSFTFSAGLGRGKKGLGIGAPRPLRAVDILEGRRSDSWDVDHDVDMHGPEDSNLSEPEQLAEHGDDPFRSRKHRFRTPSMSMSSTSATSHGLGGKDPSNYITPPPTSSSSLSCFGTGPRKGFFVPSTPFLNANTVVGPGPGSKPGADASNPNIAIIGEERKGGDVPSPHPRLGPGIGRGLKRRPRAASNLSACTSAGGEKESAVESLLRKHLFQTLSNPPAHEHSNQRHRLSNSMASVASSSAVSVPGSATDDVFSVASALTTPGGMVHGPANIGVDDGEAIELDDVLDSAFLDDSMDVTPISSRQETLVSLIPVSDDPNFTPSSAVVAESFTAKNLTRWDLISAGAFRQTETQAREPGAMGHRHSQSHTSASSADFGNAMKSSPMSMLWRNNRKGARAAAKASASRPTSRSASISASASVPASPLVQTGTRDLSTATPINTSTVKKSSGSSGKHAKRRRLMMMSASTMSSPLILPLGSGERTPTPRRSDSSSSLASSSGSVSSGGVTAVHVPSSSVTSSPTLSFSSTSSKPNTHTASNRNDASYNKTRKETRKERKLQKRRVQQQKQLPHSHSPSHHPSHQFHLHHHHPNSKTRSVGSTQRLVGGVLPLGL